jgi:hypothetical protein
MRSLAKCAPVAVTVRIAALVLAITADGDSVAPTPSGCGQHRTSPQIFKQLHMNSFLKAKRH